MKVKGIEPQPGVFTDREGEKTYIPATDAAGRTPAARHPQLGWQGRLPDIRELVVHPNYMVFYRVLDEARTVQVLRVKNVAQQP